jgi:hypothetical protein
MALLLVTDMTTLPGVAVLPMTDTLPPTGGTLIERLPVYVPSPI